MVLIPVIEQSSFTQKMSSFESEVLEGIAAQAAIRVESQLTAANASDQRRLAISAVFASVALIIASAAAITVYDKRTQIGFSIALFISFTVYLLSCVVCIYNIKSTKYCFPGVDPSQWTYDQWSTKNISQKIGKKEFLIEYIHEINIAIDINKKDAAKSARFFNLSIDLAMLATILLVIIAAEYIHGVIH